MDYYYNFQDQVPTLFDFANTISISGRLPRVSNNSCVPVIVLYSIHTLYGFISESDLSVAAIIPQRFCRFIIIHCAVFHLLRRTSGGHS